MCNGFLDETKDFKYQITRKIELKNAKAVKLNFLLFKFDLEKSFQEILYRIDNWINESSGWYVESIKSQYFNISTYRPLIGTLYIKLPAKLRSSKKD